MAKLLVVLIGGLRTELMACAQVPCLDRLIGKGIVARGLIPPSSLALPTLFSLLTSLPPQEHGVLANRVSTQAPPHAVSLLSLLRCHQSHLSAHYSDDRLHGLFPPGSPQTGILLNTQGIRNVDRQLAELAGRHLQQEQPDCCLLQLQGVEIAAVHFGPRSEASIESLEQADQSLCLILEHLALVGLEQEYVVMVLGLPLGGGGHGTEREIPALPLVLRGPGIAQGMELTRPINIVDLTPSMARILGIAPHPDWRGNTIEELFKRPAPTRLDLGRRQSIVRRRSGLTA